MQLPVHITFHNLSNEHPLRDYIQQKAEALERSYAPISSCRVFVDVNTRHLQGNVFHVRIDLKAAGNTLVVSREPARNLSNEDAYIAVRDAFDAMRSQLEKLDEATKRVNRTHDVFVSGLA